MNFIRAKDIDDNRLIVKSMGDLQDRIIITQIEDY